MKTLILMILLLSTAAHADLKLALISAGQGDKMHELTVDLSTLNELNNATDSMPQEQLNESWRSFLITAVFQSQIESEYYFRHDSFMSPQLVIEGKLNPPFLRAIVSTYREDLETFYRLAPTAIQGRMRQDVKNNSEFFYNCLNQLALQAKPASICEKISQATTLSPTQYEEFKWAYIRIVRSGSLEFTHCYSEVHTDPYLATQHAAIQEALQTERRVLEKVNVRSFFPDEESVKRWASLPFQSGKMSGARMMECRNQSYWPLGWFRSTLGATK